MSLVSPRSSISVASLTHMSWGQVEGECCNKLICNSCVIIFFLHSSIHAHPLFTSGPSESENVNHRAPCQHLCVCNNKSDGIRKWCNEITITSGHMMHCLPAMHVCVWRVSDNGNFRNPQCAYVCLLHISVCHIKSQFYHFQLIQY